MRHHNDIATDTVPQFSSASLIALLTGAVCIAFAAIFVRLSEMEPAASAFYRVFLALPPLWLWSRLEQRRQAQTVKVRALPVRQKITLALSGSFFAGDLIFWHVSIGYTSVANATLMANFAPIFVALGAYLLYGEKVKPLFMLALMLSLAGAATMVSASFFVSTTAMKGDLLGLVTAAFYGAYLLTVKGLRKDLGAGQLMFWSTLGTSIVLFPFALFSGGSMIPPDAQTWIWLILLAWFSHAMGQTLIAVALGGLPASFSSLALLLQPCLTALFGWLLLQETLGPWQTMGGLLVLAGLWLAKKSANPS